VISLLAPLGLIALAALALPVLIHLIRRSERKEVDFAALRWLSQRNRPRKQLRLHDRVLLMLRLLLIAVLALLLAQPVRFPRGEAGAVWVGVSPEIDPSAARAAVNAPTAEWHWLVPGFPSIDNAALPAEAPLASLIREADALLPSATRLSLVVPQTLNGLDAERLRLGHDVDWHPLPTPQPPPVANAAAPVLHVFVRSAGTRDEERIVVRALVKAWRAAGREVLLDESAAESIPADTTLLFWLGGEPDAAAQRWIAAGGRAIASSVPKAAAAVVMTTEDGQPLLRDAAVGRGHLFAFDAALTPQALPVLLDPGFPQKLLVQIEPPRPEVSTAAAAAISLQKIEPAPRGPPVPLDHWVALVAAVLFLLERLWATRRRRGVA
jgi:hypothetical protein